MLAVLHLKLERPVRLIDNARVIVRDTPVRRKKILDAAKSGDLRAVQKLQARYSVLYWGRHTADGDRNVVV